MAQINKVPVWVQLATDERWHPERYSSVLAKGNSSALQQLDPTGTNVGVVIEWDIAIDDYITDYDDRRMPGLAGANTEGRDGWGASAYGVFQDVRFTHRVYTLGRHRSMALRIYEEMQYAGGIGSWGTASQDAAFKNGQGLMSTAEIISKVNQLKMEEVVGPDIDRYNIYCWLTGHMSGRWVPTDADGIFSAEAGGTWVAQPGVFQQESIPPRFAPILTVEWDKELIVQLLDNITITWDNLMIPQENRICAIDRRYRLYLAQALLGQGIPVTEAGYQDLKNGAFERLWGWDFYFDIPTAYWPKIYVDGNGNVVHSANADAAYDAVINQVSERGAAAAAAADPGRELEMKLIEANRQTQVNWFRTVWDNTNKRFNHIITNYPLGAPAAVPYFGTPESETYAGGISGGSHATLPDPWAQPDEWPFAGYPGTGLEVTDPGKQGNVSLRQVIGVFLYQGAIQHSTEWSNMETDVGLTRGKFTEVVWDFKHDAWVIERYAAGVIPIIDAVEDNPIFAMPVKIMQDTSATSAARNASLAAAAGSLADIDENTDTLETSAATLAGTVDNGAIKTKDVT